MQKFAKIEYGGDIFWIEYIKNNVFKLEGSPLDSSYKKIIHPLE